MLFPLRDENPTRRFPGVTVFLIALNVAVFAWQALSPGGLVGYAARLGVIPYEVTHFRSLDPGRLAPGLTLLASMFVHGGLFHLLGNMLYLWIFGNNVEDHFGSGRFLFFYLVCGLAAAFTQVLFSPHSRVPMVGASGAIAGVLGAYFVLFPRARVMTFVFLFVFIRVVPVPAALILGFWFVAQVLNVGLGGGVAWFAHIGGFLAGVGLVLADRRLRPRPAWSD